MKRDIFIAKAIQLYGDIYDYSRLPEEVFQKDRVSIGCKIHGIFEVRAASHCSKSSIVRCPLCARNGKVDKRKFLYMSEKNHGMRYDYSNVSLNNGCKSLVTIRCKIHGEFQQNASSHMKGAGCHECDLANKRMSHDSFIERSKSIHPDMFTYERTKYVNMRTNVTVTCKKHGDFEIKPNHHIASKKRGCPQCSVGLRKSKGETKWLDLLGVESRGIRVGKYTVDGIKDNVIYEFLGDLWHGNTNGKSPSLRRTKVAFNGKTLKEMFENTDRKFKYLSSLGYLIHYVWETDWDRFETAKVQFVRTNLFISELKVSSWKNLCPNY